MGHCQHVSSCFRWWVKLKVSTVLPLNTLANYPKSKSIDQRYRLKSKSMWFGDKNVSCWRSFSPFSSGWRILSLCHMTLIPFLVYILSTYTIYNLVQVYGVNRLCDDIEMMVTRNFTNYCGEIRQISHLLIYNFFFYADRIETVAESVRLLEVLLAHINSQPHHGTITSFLDTYHDVKLHLVSIMVEVARVITKNTILCLISECYGVLLVELSAHFHGTRFPVVGGNRRLANCTAGRQYSPAAHGVSIMLPSNGNIHLSGINIRIKRKRVETFCQFHKMYFIAAVIDSIWEAWRGRRTTGDRRRRTTANQTSATVLSPRGLTFAGKKKQISN